MADFSADFDKLHLPPEIKRAIIVYQGKLTPDYTYLANYLKE
jgi:alpha-aminoadipic semialdehyde synthase